MSEVEGVRLSTDAAVVENNWRLLRQAVLSGGLVNGQTIYGGKQAGEALNLYSESAAKACFVKIGGTTLSLGTGGTERIGIDANGLITVPGMHGATGNTTTAQTITSGVYTPTLTNGTNVASSSPRASPWMRVGSCITTWGAVIVTPTAATTNTTLGMSLPVASNLQQTYDVGGAGAYVFTTNQVVAQILADVTNDIALFTFVSNGTAQHIFRYQFGYFVQ